MLVSIRKQGVGVIVKRVKIEAQASNHFAKKGYILIQDKITW